MCFFVVFYSILIRVQNCDVLQGKKKYLMAGATCQLINHSAVLFAIKTVFQVAVRVCLEMQSSQ